jgi:segregation and condensation protein A
MERLNIDVASEFIVFAATLMRIKAKMLLPRKEKNEAGEEIDPREDLIKKLIEYKRFKEVTDDFRKLEEDQSKKQKRGNVAQEIQQIAQKALVDVELESVSLYKLMNVFNRLLTKMNEPKDKVVHKIFDYKYTIEDQSDYIRSRIVRGKKLDFTNLFSKLNNRVHAIVTFLALLEMLSQQQITITQGEGPNNFWIHEKAYDEEE